MHCNYLCLQDFKNHVYTYYKSLKNYKFFNMKNVVDMIFTSFHTDPVFSCQNIKVICSCDSVKFCNFWKKIEWRLKERSFRIKWSRSTAFLGTLWRLAPRVRWGKLLTHSSFGVEWVQVILKYHWNLYYLWVCFTITTSTLNTCRFVHIYIIHDIMIMLLHFSCGKI